MNREQKNAQVADIRDRFSRMSSAVVTNFKGINVETMTSLRNEFRKVGVEYKVVKNTLIGIALNEETYHGKLSAHLAEPTAVAWGYDDPAAAAKVAIEFAKKNDKLKIKCAVVDGQVIEGEKVIQLSKMPSKDQLRASLLATFMAPAQTFVRLLAAAPTNFVYVLDARKRQKDSE